MGVVYQCGRARRPRSTLSISISFSLFFSLPFLSFSHSSVCVFISPLPPVLIFFERESYFSPLCCCFYCPHPFSASFSSLRFFGIFTTAAACVCVSVFASVCVSVCV